MKLNTLISYLSLLWLLSILPGTALSQEKTGNIESQPEEGIAGKDVPWISTPQELVEAMLNLAKITPRDFLIDLGSGDGRIVITAAKSGTRALGVEYNPDLVKLAKRNAEKEGVATMVQFVETDLYEYDFSKATVITMFLLPYINVKLRPKLLNLKPGTRIVSNTFTMQDWRYDEMAKTSYSSGRWNTAYLWIVPAKVEGKWSLSQGGDLLLKQEFQALSGAILVGEKIFTITEGRLRGNEITFKANGNLYTGLVTDRKIEGTFTSGKDTNKWSASR